MAGKGSAPGERRGGRKKGVPNKITGDIRAAVQQAFDDAGGSEYLTGLAKSHPQVFCSLVGKIIPTKIEGDLKVTLDQLVAASLKPDHP